jgi:hypothetical protein
MGSSGVSGSGGSLNDGGAATCDRYCTAITANCTGANAQYTSKANCMTACAFLPATDVAGNTVTCRAGVASMASAASDANCWHAGAETFGGCGDECEAFCILTMGYCPGVYASMTDCVAACQNFGRIVDNITPGGSFSVTGPVTGDTLECRFSDLVANAMQNAASQQADCPHAGAMSAVCQGAPPVPGGGVPPVVGDASTYIGHYDGGAIPTTVASANWSETTYPFATRRMLVRDEGNPHMHLLDLGNTANNWSTRTDGAWARGTQLIGNNQVLGGRNDGYEVYDLNTGGVLKRIQGFPNTQSAYRMANGETMLTTSGTTLNFLDPVTDKVAHTISYPGYGYVRMARPTRNGTFLVPSDTTLFEGDANGQVLWKTAGAQWSHIWEALLLGPLAGPYNGDVLLATAFGSSLDVIDKTTHMVKFRYGSKGGSYASAAGNTQPALTAAIVSPTFFAEFQILPNGNVITTNFTGGRSPGIQIIEFDPAGNVVWYYKQDPLVFSSIQGVMVLDGLDPQYLHVQETEDSTWQPVK